ncbi:hypothetical protein Y032_0318g2352 [Ancylostoma ceylanicum]|uniref:Uncharacterized protein n=1 Tax=Ancylostoma ceylanicum TaxID=53326 RepID=A0A016S264_9BILA|nr:hypothetical protein Y032_0318g2352 [Ancylostoma ceylanicum]
MAELPGLKPKGVSTVFLLTTTNAFITLQDIFYSFLLFYLLWYSFLAILVFRPLLLGTVFAGIFSYQVGLTVSEATDKSITTWICLHVTAHIPSFLFPDVRSSGHDTLPSYKVRPGSRQSNVSTCYHFSP